MKAKSKIKMFAIIALVALVAVGSTLAYLSSVTDTKENKFTSGKGITGTIEEEKWTHGEDGWKDYTPGESTGKDPLISITDEGEDAYVGMKVECIGADGTVIPFDQFEKDYATVSYDNAAGINTTNWEKLDGYNEDFYIYKGSSPNFNNILAKGQKTEPLFDKVTINLGIVRTYGKTTDEQTIVTYDVDEDGNKLEGTEKTQTGQVIVSETTKIFIKNADGSFTEVTNDATLPTFNINVTGYAIQKTGNEGQFAAELAKLAKLTQK